jgi:hypothetical protein
MVADIKRRSEFTYNCKICSMENLHSLMKQSDLPVTRIGKTSLTDEYTTATPLYLSDGSTLTLSDGSTLTISGEGISVKRGYETFTSSMYSATSISFVAASGSVPAYLLDSMYRFGDQHIQSNMMISISTTSATNNGNYTIADRGVSRGEILLTDDYSLTTESAAAAGTVVISRILFQRNVVNGCPFCGSLASR